MDIISDNTIITLMHKLGYNIDTKDIFRNNDYQNYDHTYVWINEKLNAIIRDMTQELGVSSFGVSFKKINDNNNVTKIKVDENNQNITFNGEIIDSLLYQLLQLTNYDIFNNPLIYRCRSHNNMIWVEENMIHLYVKYQEDQQIYYIEQLNDLVMPDEKIFYAVPGELLNDEEYKQYQKNNDIY